MGAGEPGHGRARPVVKPGVGGGDRGVGVYGLAAGAALSPAVEPGGGAPRVEVELGSDAVLFGVAQHVAEGVSHLARGLDDAVVEAVGDDAAASLPEGVEAAGNADEQALHVARQGLLVLGLND